jgi:uncharacterized protein (TIGR03086 family)
MTDWTREVERLVEHGRDREAAAVAVRHLPGPIPQGGAMEPLVQLDELAPLLGTIATTLDPAQLDAPTPCADFTVRGVLEHMIGGGTAFAALFRGETPPAPDTNPSGDTLERFGQAMGNLVEAMRAPGALDRTIAAPFGDTPGDQFARFVVLDGLVHGWDISTATGRPYDPPAALVDEVQRFAERAITPAMRQNGMFADPAAPPTDATPIERLVAFTGRRVERSSS